MNTNQIKSKFDLGEKYLEAAQSELNRPAEDVVPYMVCRSSRLSITYFLEGYLLQRGVKVDREVSAEALLEKCRAINSRFNSFDLDMISFEMDEEFSAELDKMEGCVDLALQAKQITEETIYSK